MKIPRQRKRIVAWLLAVIVVVGVVSPPGYRHTHVGGDARHDHQSQIEHQQSLADLERHGHHHATHHTASLTGHVVHTHAAILWIGITLSVPANSDSEPSKSDRDDLPVLVRIADACLPTAGDRSSTSSFTAAESPVLTTAAVPSSSSTKYAQPTVASVLLCDTARHERSGVLCI